MLVFARKKNEAFFIGNTVKVTVVEIRGDRVRLGIDAPEHIKIDREEVREQQRAEAERKPPSQITKAQP